MRPAVSVVFVVAVFGSSCSDSPSEGGDVRDVASDSGGDTVTTAAPDTVSEPQCTGTPTRCSELTSNGNLCILTTGCDYEAADCTGTPEPCILRYSLETCETGFGCFWSSLDQECDGAAAPCSSHKSMPDDCEAIGCTFTEAVCSGTTAPCSTAFDEQSCLYKNGCVWVD